MFSCNGLKFSFRGFYFSLKYLSTRAHCQTVGQTIPLMWRVVSIGSLHAVVPSIPVFPHPPVLKFSFRGFYFSLKYQSTRAYWHTVGQTIPLLWRMVSIGSLHAVVPSIFPSFEVPFSRFLLIFKIPKHKSLLAHCWPDDTTAVDNG